MDQNNRLVDAILVADSIANQLHETSNTGGLAFPIPMEPLLQEVKRQSGVFGIELVAKNIQSRQISSMLLRYDQAPSKILYSSTLNLCFKRFCVCKEAVHLMMDSEPKHYTKDVIELVQQLITSITFSPHTPLESEYFAVIVALEMLVPYRLRGELKVMLDEGATFYDVALKCRVPEKYISLLFQSEYGKMSAQLRDCINQ